MAIPKASSSMVPLPQKGSQTQSLRPSAAESSRCRRSFACITWPRNQVEPTPERPAQAAALEGSKSQALPRCS